AAEYRAASPNRTSATDTPSSGLSSSRTRLNMSGVARECVLREGIARQGVAPRRVRERGQDLHFVRRGVRREHDLVLRRFGGIGAEIAGDDPGDERRHVRTLARKLDDGSDDDLRL